jgi:hypothetical protein
MVEPVHRSSLLQSLCETPLTPPDGPTELLGERLVLPKLCEDGLVEEVLDVLLVVERGRGGGPLVGAFGRGRDSGEDALEDAKSSEVGQGTLELLERLVPGDVVLSG